MATIVTVETNVVITEGGVSVVDRTLTKQYEVTDKVEGSLWLDATTPVVTICVKGTNLVTGGPGGQAIIDPMVIPLSNIRGIALDAELDVEINLDTIEAPVDVISGSFSIAETSLSLIEITRSGAATGAVKFVVWGDR